VKTGTFFGHCICFTFYFYLNYLLKIVIFICLTDNFSISVFFTFYVSFIVFHVRLVFYCCKLYCTTSTSCDIL